MNYHTNKEFKKQSIESKSEEFQLAFKWATEIIASHCCPCTIDLFLYTPIHAKLKASFITIDKSLIPGLPQGLHQFIQYSEFGLKNDTYIWADPDTGNRLVRQGLPQEFEATLELIVPIYNKEA